VFNDEWMANYGFVTECDLCVSTVLGSRGTMPRLLYVNPSDTVRDAINLMRTNGVSQLPVCKNEPPFAAAEVSGAVDELELMDAAFHDPSVLDTPVEKVMGAKLPTVGIGQPLALVVELLNEAPALLVLSGGRPLSVLTRTDVLAFLSGGESGG
jgi:cystathionine beta-synthase